jgi:hypothetical protein
MVMLRVSAGFLRVGSGMNGLLTFWCKFSGEWLVSGVVATRLGQKGT